MNLLNFNNIDLSRFNKKFLFIIAGVIVLLGIVTLLSLPQSQKPITSSTRSTITKAPGQTNTTVNTQATTLGPTSPEQVALRFYDWYISHPNPLGSRAYERSVYITNKYKKNLRLLVNDGTHVGNEVVFNCVGVIPPKKVIAQAAVYDGTERSYVVLKQDIPNSQPLYQVDIHNVGGEWLINDIWCKL